MTLAAAAEFPAKPVRLIIPFAAGGSNDITARIFAPPLSRGLGQSVVIENRPGASGIVAAELVARAPADGNTLLIGGAGFLITSVTHPKPPYDVLKDFAFVARITSNTWIVCVHPSLPVKNIKELIALARARPGELAYASAGTGSGQHLSGEMLKLMAKIDIIHVPFQGSGPASIAAVGGHTGILIADMASIVQAVAAGKLRPLAVTTRARSPQLPAVPSMAESGLPDFELNSFVGVEAPAATPRDVVTRLSAEFARAASLPEVKDNLFKQGSQVAPLNADEFDAFFRADMRKIQKLVKEANIKLE